MQQTCYLANVRLDAGHIRGGGKGPDERSAREFRVLQEFFEVRQIENKQYRLDSEGATFDGRDLFAPAAAWLTKGQPPGSYGRLIQDYVRLPAREAVVQGGVNNTTTSSGTRKIRNSVRLFGRFKRIDGSAGAR